MPIALLNTNLHHLCAMFLFTQFSAILNNPPPTFLQKVSIPVSSSEKGIILLKNIIIDNINHKSTELKSLP